MVTSRAKDFASLKEKCIKRYETRQYESFDDVRNDIPDLAGVRVALYFPGERDRVDAIIVRLFEMLEERIEHPRPSGESDTGVDNPNVQSKRFPGYSAIHYRVALREDGQDGNELRFLDARIEIQVASVLMHGWSEVEHDLVYKPNAPLSPQEEQLIDQLNGLIHAGEITLELLQKAGQQRIEDGARSFVTHYELAAYLLSYVRGIRKEAVTETELGRVDVLFSFLQRVEILTPDELRPFVDGMHTNLDRRPVAEQVADAIFDARPESMDIYLSEVYRHSANADSNEEMFRNILVGQFMAKWMKLERMVVGEERSRVSFPRALDGLLSQGLPVSVVANLQRARMFRNEFMHGHFRQEPEWLAKENALLDKAISEVAHYLQSGSNQTPTT